MEIYHIELKKANKFVTEHHRHHKAVQGHRFSIGCFEKNKIVGMAIVGRPRSRKIDQYNTIEVLRLCTDGTKNVCSKLYGASAKAGKVLGYEIIITYILNQEQGTSLRAAGWKYKRISRGGDWNVLSRPRKTESPTCPKKLFVKDLCIRMI